MPSTSRRSSHFDNNEINNNNIGYMQSPSNPSNSNCVVSTTSVASGAATATATGGTPSSSSSVSVSVAAMLPMVSVAKGALLNDKSTESAAYNVTPATTTAAAAAALTTKHARAAGVTSTASSVEQRRQSQNANVRLINLVRRRPWLYDSSHCNYAKKHLIEKTWTQIGRTCNETGPICKERWRNIRAAFARSINIYKTQSGPNRLKPYYLHRELQFLINPMTKGRKSQLKLDDSSAEEASCEEQEDHDMDDQAQLLMDEDAQEEEEDEEKENGDDVGSVDENPVATTSGNRVVPTKKGGPPKSAAAKSKHAEDAAATRDTNNSIAGTQLPADVIVEDSTNFSFSDDTPECSRILDCDDVSQQLTRLKKDRFEDIPDDADLLFVKSLYYDMSGLDASQKRRLKRFIYEALEQISASSTAPSMSSTTVPAVPALSVPTPGTLTSTKKQSFSLIRNLDETQLQYLNHFIQHELVPTSNEISPKTPPNRVIAANTATHRPMQNAAVPTRSPPRTPNTSRVPAAFEAATNGRLPPFPHAVKEESLDDSL